MGDESDGQPKPDSSSSKDRIIGRRTFEIGGGLDLSDFMIGQAIEEARDADVRADEIRAEVAAEAAIDTAEGVTADDEAVGNILDPFEAPEEDDSPTGRAGEILRDGTIAVAPGRDSVTEFAVEGEKRLHWSLMVTMIVVFSLIGWLVGTILPPLVGGFGLLILAGFGLWLGERWIPNPNMRILGVTWVIISMKLLYGLVIDLHQWGILAEYTPTGIGAEAALGGLMVVLVGLNIFIAYHHDEDAIAAQATLVTLALASATGAIYGEVGLALMIGIATILLHGLALMRKSGNLASLGIAASNLWIGVHALSNDWSIIGLDILSFDDALLLFLLMTFVNAVNATMAARFYKSENWFSSALSVVGLGRPGLWGVSVGLGMVGALMAIAANRSETGYALAQVILLAAAFGGSYLAVRGVPIQRLQTHLIYPLPVLILALVGLELGLVNLSSLGLSAYAIFAIGATAVTGFALLKHQTAVSDHVIWLGGIVIIILLTILVPADDIQGGRFLLIGVGSVCGGLAMLALLRNSPSLAGVAILMPWLWALVFATDLEARVIKTDVIPIQFAELDLAFFLAAIILLQQPVNQRLGATGVNLTSRLLGMSEISTRLRDSGLFRLWNIALLASLIGILMIIRPGALSSEGLVVVFFILLGVHVGAEIIGRHQNNPQFLIIVFGISALILQWRFGLDAVWLIFITLATLPLVSAELERLEDWLAGADSVERGVDDIGPRPQPERIISLQMGMAAASTLLFYISKSSASKPELSVIYWWPSATLTAWIFVVTVAAILTLYLPKAATFDRLLQPALSCIILLVSLIVAVNDSAYSAWPFWSALALFVISGAWLVTQGEIRSGIASVARREQRIKEFTAPAASQDSLVSLATLGGESTTPASNLDEAEMFDPRIIELVEKQKKRRQRSGSIGEHDLIAGDIHHRPVIVLTFVIGLLAGVTWWSFFSGQGEAMLAVGGVMSLLFIGLSRWRASTLNLRLPDIAGIEAPIAWTMLGLAVTYLAGRLSLTYVSTDDQLSLLILVLAVTILAGFSLLDRPDLPIRIPSAIEWILFILAGTRVITFLLGGRMPTPLGVDPLDGDLLLWILPWSVQELVLIVAIIIWDWIESQRLQRNLPDHRSAGGRAMVVVLVAIISLGPALLLAIGLALRRAIDWDQPAVGMVSLPLILVAWVALESWSKIPFFGTLAVVPVVVALTAVALAIHSIARVRLHWTTAWLWDVQVLLPIAALIALREYTSVFVISLLGVSLLTWTSGVLQHRRGWRIIGALNLLSAWLVAIFSLQSGVFDPVSTLAMLIATGILLGVVTWLNQAYESELAAD
jgi:hypothetical protein